MGYRPGRKQRLPLRGLPGSQVLSWLNFTPAFLRPDLWLDAADSTTITESSGAVSQWNDKSGNGYNFTQGTGLSQPITGTRTQNGLNVIDFNGSSHWFSAGDVLDLGTSSLNFFAVCKFDKLQPSTLLGKYKVNPAVGSWLLLGENIGGTGFRSYYIGASGVTFQNFSLTSNTLIGNYRLDRTAGTLSNTIDGFDVGRTTFTPDDGTSRNISTHLYMGQLRNSGDNNFFPGYGFDGFVAEIVLFLRSLTTAETAQMRAYLVKKWATP